jgi:hypothetical protein
MLDMQVMVRLLVLRHSASITCISSMMRPGRAKVISDYPHMPMSGEGRRI